MELQLATRPVRPDDLSRFYALWPRLSRDTRYRRFHAPVRTLPAATVRRLVEVDHDLREAVVALVGDDVVGVARYDRSPADPTSAELAVVVEDDWQGLGLGRQLMAGVLVLAAVRGVDRVIATVQEDNTAALRLVARLLSAATVECEDGICTVVAALGVPTPRPAVVAG